MIGFVTFFRAPPKPRASSSCKLRGSRIGLSTLMPNVGLSSVMRCMHSFAPCTIQQVDVYGRHISPRSSDSFSFQAVTDYSLLCFSKQSRSCSCGVLDICQGQHLYGLSVFEREFSFIFLYFACIIVNLFFYLSLTSANFLHLTNYFSDTQALLLS